LPPRLTSPWLASGASPPTGYAFAAGTVAAALAARYLLRDTFGVAVPYLQFYPAIIAAAWFGGVGPALLATLLSSAAAAYYFLPPDGLGVDLAVDQLSLGFFMAIGLGLAWLVDRLQRAEAGHHAAAATARARAERLDAVLNTTADGIIVIDSRGRIESFNRGAEQLFGYPEAEVLGRNVSVLMPSPHHEEHDHYLERYQTTGEARIIGVGREVVGRRRDGVMFPVHLSVGQMNIGGERKFTGLLQDLTRRVRLEGELGASEARWRAIIDSAVDGIIVIDAHGRVEAFNPAAERLFGYAPAEVLGHNVDMLMPSPYHEQHDSYLSRYLATGRAKIIGIGREVQGRRKDGTTFPLHLSVGQITIAGERKFTGILHDLSGRVALEGKLREQQSLAHLGEMAAVVAHEVKNPLAGIRGAIQLFAGRTADEVSREILADIVLRIDALDGMMKDLLLFARPPRPRRSPTDVGLLVTSTAALLARDPTLQDVVVDIGGGAPAVPVDAEMLRIVLHNLLVNGAHAMRGQGRITVDIDTADSTCRIRIADAGPGIPAEIREKIFTPFFTTKSRGSGLGLPTAKRLVEAHEGSIAIDCPPSGGTTVMIQLPLGAAN
jgi:two-component system, LuxR family, sensor kinase FixL